MNEKAVKILEIGGEAWMGGISLQPTLPVAGIFKQATNFDPFKTMGVFSPSLAPTQQGAISISTAGAFNVGFEVAGKSYFYSFADGTKLYRINTVSTFGDVDDLSAKISDIASIKGAIKHKNKIVYASATSLKFNNTDTSAIDDGFTLANQRGIMSLSSAGHVMLTAPDRNLYITNLNQVARVTTMTAASGGVPASGNTPAYLSFEDDVILRDLATDGNYVVILGDTNSNWISGANTKVRCFVAFWNMKSQDLVRIWEFEDNVTYGLEFTGEEFIVHGRDNVYTCTVDSPIEPLISRRGNTNITPALIYPGGIIRKDGSVMWGEGGNIYAYGRPHRALKKILYQPYTLSSSSVLSLFPHQNGVWAMTADNKLYEFSSGSSSQESIIQLSDVDFKRPYRFAFVKIILTDPLGSGDSVQVAISTQNGNKIILSSAANYMDFTADGAISSKIIYPQGIGSPNDASLFEDSTTIKVTNNNGASIRRVEIWAYPAAENQTLGY